MTVISSGFISTSVFSPAVIFSSTQLQEKNKTHYYTISCQAHDHVFAAKQGGVKAYMTAQGKGIQAGDYLILQAGSSYKRYQVDKIAYYSEPPDMWVALLKKEAI